MADNGSNRVVGVLLCSFGPVRMEGVAGFLAKRGFSFCGLKTTVVVMTRGMTLAVKLALKDKGVALGINAPKER